MYPPDTLSCRYKPTLKPLSDSWSLTYNMMFYFVILQDSAVCTGSSEIKSRAVVKYSAAPPPTSYALLQEKTDLKLPPANWLRENPQLGSAGTTILGSSSKSKPFSRYNTMRNTITRTDMYCSCVKLCCGEV